MCLPIGVYSLLNVNNMLNATCLFPFSLQHGVDHFHSLVATSLLSKMLSLLQCPPSLTAKETNFLLDIEPLSFPPSLPYQNPKSINLFAEKMLIATYAAQETVA